MGIIIRKVADVTAELTILAAIFTAIELLGIVFIAIAIDEHAVLTVTMLMRFVLVNYMLAGLIAIAGKMGWLHK